MENHVAMENYPVTAFPFLDVGDQKDSTFLQEVGFQDDLPEAGTEVQNHKIVNRNTVQINDLFITLKSYTLVSVNSSYIK